MCGICGKFNFNRDNRVPLSLLKDMADAIAHRGPDDEGFYTAGPVGLGFRRLSIIDLAGGHQPLCNENGTVWIVFNGEIYNYQDLHSELVSKGHVFRTKSDTEVIVHLYEEYGTDCLHKMRGMFAFGIWDATNQTLFLARDRVGIKPLYYYVGDEFISFGSEMKAILADRAVCREIDPEVIDLFLTYYYVPGDKTLLRGVYKLEPGYFLTVRNGKVGRQQYWDLDFSPQADGRAPADYGRELIELLEESVALHTISDVPVGLLLSGGLDSTAMLSLASRKTDKPISTYTVGFSSPDVIDERPYARIASRQFGSRHYEISMSSNEFADFVPKYVWHMEEPIVEPPAVALFYVSKLASKYVKVLISGEGGDEAFAGYENFRNLFWFENLKKVIGPLRIPAAGVISELGKLFRSRVLLKYGPLLKSEFTNYYFSRTSNPFQYFNLCTDELYTAQMAATTRKQASIDAVRKHLDCVTDLGILEKMLYVDTKTWLPDDLLVKADKMTMANSIELRVPFLDHKVLEFAAGLPRNQKIRGLTMKYLARKALKAHVPEEILKRRKAGFPVPYAGWLRTNLRDYVRGLLLDPVSKARGYFQPKTVEKLIRQHEAGGSFSKEIFALVVLELWHRTFADGLPKSEPLPFPGSLADFKNAALLSPTQTTNVGGLP